MRIKSGRSIFLSKSQPQLLELTLPLDNVYSNVYKWTMRTNIVLDEDIVREAKRLTKIRTTKGVVEEALRQLIQTKKRKPLSELFGKVKLAGGYDYKSSRS